VRVKGLKVIIKKYINAYLKYYLYKVLFFEQSLSLSLSSFFSVHVKLIIIKISANAYIDIIQSANEILFVRYRYNVRWYVASLHTQKLILFILRRSGKVFGLNIGNLFMASLESFATVNNNYYISYIILNIIHHSPLIMQQKTYFITVIKSIDVLFYLHVFYAIIPNYII